MRNFFSKTMVLIALCMITSACEEFKQIQNRATAKISNTPEVENIFKPEINSNITLEGKEYSITEEYTSATNATCRVIEGANKKLFCKDKATIREYRYLK